VLSRFQGSVKDNEGALKDNDLWRSFNENITRGPNDLLYQRADARFTRATFSRPVLTNSD
jgi:hypothetical protein